MKIAIGGAECTAWVHYTLHQVACMILKYSMALNHAATTKNHYEALKIVRGRRSLL